MANARRRNYQWTHRGLYRLEGFELILPRRQTTFAVSQKSSHDGGVDRRFGVFPSGSEAADSDDIPSDQAA
jgi:hypothetical protein